MRIRDTRMYKKALVQGWDISDQQRQEMIEHFEIVLDDPDASDRERQAAQQGLEAAGVALDRQS